MPWSRKQREEIEYLAGVIQQGRQIGASYMQIAGRLVETDLPGMGYQPPADGFEPRSTRRSLPVDLVDRIRAARTSPPLGYEESAAALNLLTDLQTFFDEADEADRQDAAAQTAGSGALLPGSGPTPTREGETRGND